MILIRWMRSEEPGWWIPDEHEAPSPNGHVTLRQPRRIPGKEPALVIAAGIAAMPILATAAVIATWLRYQLKHAHE